MAHISLLGLFGMVLATCCRESDASFGAGATGYKCPTLFNYYGDVRDCTKFYRCVWGQAYTFNCPAGTRWSQAILTCDHAYNVPCDSDPGYLALPSKPKAVYSAYEEDSPNEDEDYEHENYYDYDTQPNDGYGSYGSKTIGYSRPTQQSYGFAPTQSYGFAPSRSYGFAPSKSYGFAPAGFNGYGFGYGYNHGYNSGYQQPRRRPSFLAGQKK